MFKFEEIMFRNSGMDATQLAQAKLDEMLAAIRMAMPEEVLSPEPGKVTVVDRDMGRALTAMQKELRGLASRVPGSHAERDVANGVFVFDGREGRAAGASAVWDNRQAIPVIDYAESHAVAMEAATMLSLGILDVEGRPYSVRGAIAAAQGKLEHIAERGLREALERFGDEAAAEAADLIASGSADLSEAMEACARVEVAMALGQSVGTAPLDGATIVAQGTLTGQEIADPAYFDALVASAVAGAMSSPSIDLEAVAEAVDGPTPPEPASRHVEPDLDDLSAIATAAAECLPVSETGVSRKER